MLIRICLLDDVFGANPVIKLLFELSRENPPGLLIECQTP